MLYILACSRRYTSTRKLRINDVLLTSKAVVEVQMKLRSHWLLLCKFKWHFIRQIVGQGEQHIWVYRAQRCAPKARESCTDGCTVHKEALKRPGRAVQTGVQITKRRSRSWLCREQVGAPKIILEIKSAWTVQPVPTAHSKIASRRPGRDARGARETPSWTQDAFKKCVQETPSCAQEAPRTDQVRLKFVSRGSKLDPKYVQERFGHILEAIWTLDIFLVRRCEAQEASKRRPRGSKWSPRGAQETPS